MTDALLYDRLQFAATAAFHYLFPQLTMGLALSIVCLEGWSLWSGDEHYRVAAKFWTKIFAANFAFGVVTGIPMEFQFGTNWARFSNVAGGVIGQTLAMEGVFAFFLESSFLGILLFGERRFGPRVHAFAALMIFLGAWLSAYFILATNAWMQHPMAYSMDPAGRAHVTSLWGLLTNPWLLWQYAHTMTASVATSAFAMSAVGAFYILSGIHTDYAKTFLRTGIAAAALASVLLLYPTGDGNARQVFEHQPVKGAAFEALFRSETGAGVVIIGQPNMETLTLDNPLVIPRALSLLLAHHGGAEVKGLDAFPRSDWPDNIPLLYYAYHIMVGLGTIFIAITVPSAVLLWRGRLFKARGLLWLILLSAPFPYIATTAGWMTAELGRQPWLVYGLLRTADGTSPLVHSGNALFTLLGFLGLYLLLGILFLLVVLGAVRHGPSSVESARSTEGRRFERPR